MSKQKPKSSKLVPYAIIGVVAVAVVAGMFAYVGKQQRTSQAPSSIATDASVSNEDAAFAGASSENSTFGSAGHDAESTFASFEEESEQRLANLREQEAELNTIYEGTEESVYQGELDDPVLLDGQGGQFSNFDAPREPEPAEEVPPALESEDDIEQEPEYAEPTPDDVLSQSLMDETPPATATSELNPRLQAMDERISSLSNSLQVIRATLSDSALPSGSEVDALHSDIKDLRQRVAALGERITALSDSNTNAGLVDTGRLETLAERFEDFTGDMAERLKGLDERLEDVADSGTEAPNDSKAADDSGSTRASAPAAAPRRPAVTGLYELLAIEGNVAVLEGQNTGRVYRIAEGGDLAYGGRLLDIQGDRAVLAWPHSSVELSIYGP